MEAPAAPADPPGTDPYRSGGPQRSFCNICHADRVVGACPRCNKPFCLEHLNHTAPHLCGDCDGELHRRRGRINRLVGGIAALAGGAGAAAILLSALTPVMAPFGLLLGAVVFAIAAPTAHRVSRRRFYRDGAPDAALQLEGELQIGPNGGPRGVRRTLSPRRGGHDPPGRPPDQRFGYHG